MRLACQAGRSVAIKVATIAAAALGINTQRSEINGYGDNGAARRVVNRNAQTLTGLDVLAAENFASLTGKRVGLITNHTGIDRNGARNLDLMKKAGVNIVAVFSPEHGLQGKLDQENVGDSTDEASGVPVISLYQPSRRKLPPQLTKGIDTLVFDIQDVGARFYTYSCTLLYAMETAAAQKIPFIVLDRPNPITGSRVEGPLLDHKLKSFVGCYEMPTRHGLTFGELAQMANSESGLKLDLRVVPMQNWERGDWFDATGLPWRDPSPNMRSLNAATLYTAVAPFEASRNLCVGSPPSSRT